MKEYMNIFYGLVSSLMTVYLLELRRIYGVTLWSSLLGFIGFVFVVLLWTFFFENLNENKKELKNERKTKGFKK